jgi:chromosome segregation ATPase
MKDGKAGGGVVLSDEKGNKVPGAATELRTICDFFNIQVDNPINILSQDNARQFLAVSTAKDKYQFFLKGTLLAQLLEDYDKLASNQNELDKTIQNQLAAVKELHEDAREAARKWKLVESALSSADELERKKKQLAWSYVVAAEIVSVSLLQSARADHRAAIYATYRARDHPA